MPRVCSVTAEFNYPHEGHVRIYGIMVYTQPPGHGSFKLKTQVAMCDAHRKWWEDGHVNLQIGAARER